ncbi:MAG: class I SAM-dependent methyltransferase [Kiritimatiellae bacterium]|nr:class I SAM-dependent methyltransferase [Kiritimatiellia bacterium]
MAGRIRQAMTRNIALRPGMDVLDFGCGTGLLSLPWAPQVRSLTGADTSAGMLEVFLAKARKQGLTNVQIRHLQHGERMQGRYDAVFSSMTFHHVENLDALLSDLFRVLRAPGYLCVADLDPDGGHFHSDPTGVFHPGLDRSGLMQRFRAAGFSGVRETTATEVVRTGADGLSRSFRIFLVTGRKRAAKPGSPGEDLE